MFRPAKVPSMAQSRTYHGGPVVRVAKESIGFEARAYRENPLSSDSAHYLRRWARDYREFVQREYHRRQFFKYWQPDMEMA